MKIMLGLIISKQISIIKTTYATFCYLKQKDVNRSKLCCLQRVLHRTLRNDPWECVHCNQTFFPERRANMVKHKNLRSVVNFYHYFVNREG